MVSNTKSSSTRSIQTSNYSVKSNTRTLVTFQTEKFNTTTDRDYFINPGCFGDDLCKWLIEQLTADGIKCDAQPGQEDFGWYFNFSVDDEEYCWVCAFRPADETEPGIWIGWIEKATGFLAGIFGGREKNIQRSASLEIHKVLVNSSEISNIRWHIRADFERGNEDAAHSSPD